MMGRVRRFLRACLLLYQARRLLERLQAQAKLAESDNDNERWARLIRLQWKVRNRCYRRQQALERRAA